LSNFSLVILEYCEPEQCLDREDYYISSLNPDYNILSKAGSSLGYRHSVVTRERMSVYQKTVDRTGENNPSFGITVSEETRAKLFATQKDNCQRIEVVDLDTNETTSYDSIRAAGRALDIKQSRISTYFGQNQKSPYKGRYIFKKID
jgi:hypothetical protein